MDVHVGVVRVELERAVERDALLGELPLLSGDQAEGSPGLGERGVELRRQARVAPSLGERRAEVLLPERVNHRQPGVSARELRVELERLREPADRLTHARVVALVEGCGRLQVERVGLWIPRGHRHESRLLVALQDHFELLGDAARDALLQLEHVRQLAVEGLRPQVEAIGRLDELRRDPHLVALLAHRAF